MAAMTSTPGVVTVGLTTVDLSYFVADPVRPGRKAVAESMSIDAGGPAANAARAAALLGSPTTVHTMLGQGLMAANARSILEAQGVRVVDHTPPQSEWQVPVSTAIVTPDGERTVVSVNAAGAPRPTSDGGDHGGAGGTAVVVVDGHHLPLAGAVMANAPRAIVVLDAGSWKPDLDKILPSVDVAIVSADFLVPAEHESLFRSIPFSARSDGPQPVRAWSHAGAAATVPVRRVDAVDTLGAGDVLHGAFAHFIAGRPLTFDSVVTALRLATDVATESCLVQGVTGWSAPRV